MVVLASQALLEKRGLMELMAIKEKKENQERRERWVMRYLVYPDWKEKPV